MRHNRSISTIRAMAAIAAVPVLAALVVPAAATSAAAPARPAPAATECAALPFSWSGSASVAPGETFATGSAVPVEIGVQLAVRAVDVSTMEAAPGVLAVSVGSTTAAAGAAIAGGEIAVANSGSVAVVVTRVELSIDRCYQVESAPAAAVPPPAPASASPASALPASVEAVPAVPAAGLPETGQSSGVVMALAAVCTALGVGLRFVGRRRITASGPAR